MSFIIKFMFQEREMDVGNSSTLEQLLALAISKH